MKKKTSFSTLLALALLLTTACERPPDAGEDAAASLAGTWRAVLLSPGGELPFVLRVTKTGGRLGAVAVTGPEEVPFSSVEQNGPEVVLRFAWYDSEITARLAEGGDEMVGTWRKTVPEGDSTLPFQAERGSAPRFRPVGDPAADPPRSVAGHWAVELRDEDGTEPARGELEQDGSRVTGTFLTPTGDYRYLEGSLEEGVLRLSTFDGAHAFLFSARATADDAVAPEARPAMTVAPEGRPAMTVAPEARPAMTLAGDFWSRDNYHATWTARRIAEDELVLPDAWSEVGLTNDEGRFRFRFPNLEGREVSLTDERFVGKVVLVNVFGSWCPNCNDEAPLLAAWHRRYGGEGLEVVGLAYEFSGDVERDRQMVRRFAERHGVEYPLLLAGTSDKKGAAATLPDLTAVLSYPTTVFVGRDGKVRRIHSGFSGPGTGAHHERLVTEVEGLIEELLAEAL